MAKQVINIGTRPNSKDGDAIRDAFNKVNQNFNELYAITSGTVEGITELAQDYAAQMLVSGVHSGITVNYDDVNHRLNLSLADQISTDLTGSVFSNNSTLLVDAVNGTIPYSVISGTPTTLAGYGITDSPTDISDLSDTQNLLGQGQFAGTSLAHLELTDRITVIGSPISFTKEPNTTTTDPIDTGLELTRPVGIGAGLINIAVESSWNTETSPAGTEWNWDGWANLDDVKLRTYSNLRQALRHRIGENIVGAELVMHDIANDKYYKMQFTSWARGPAHTGAFAYTRQLIDTSALVGLHFADGSGLVKAPKEFVDLPQIFSGDTNEYILGLADRGKHVYAFTESVIKIPTDAQVDFPIGSTIFIVTGVFATNKVVKVACTAPTTIEREGSAGALEWALKPYSTTMLIKVAENKWNLSGGMNLSAVNQSIIPTADITYDLGSQSKRFRDLYLSGNTIDLGGIELTNVNGSLTTSAPIISTSGISAPSGRIDTISVVAGGSGYLTAPSVTVAAPASGTTATATATVSSGSVVSISVTDSGSGYTSTPTVIITAPTPTPNKVAISLSSASGNNWGSGGDVIDISTNPSTYAYQVWIVLKDRPLTQIQAPAAGNNFLGVWNYVSGGAFTSQSYGSIFTALGKWPGQSGNVYLGNVEFIDQVGYPKYLVGYAASDLDGRVSSVTQFDDGDLYFDWSDLDITSDEEVLVRIGRSNPVFAGDNAPDPDVYPELPLSLYEERWFQPTTGNDSFDNEQPIVPVEYPQNIIDQGKNTLQSLTTPATVDPQYHFDAPIYISAKSELNNTVTLVLGAVDFVPPWTIQGGTVPVYPVQPNTTAATFVAGSAGVQATAQANLELANVIRTPSYNDIQDAPTIPADISDLTDTEGLLVQGGAGSVQPYLEITNTPFIKQPAVLGTPVTITVPLTGQGAELTVLIENGGTTLTTSIRSAGTGYVVGQIYKIFYYQIGGSDGGSDITLTVTEVGNAGELVGYDVVWSGPNIDNTYDFVSIEYVPTQVIDPIDTGLALTRDLNRGIYNIELEQEFNRGNYLSPLGTEWNSEGWGDLLGLGTRTYATWTQALNNNVGNEIVASELVMHDTANDKYYKFDFHTWGGSNGGYSYTRTEVTDPNYFRKPHNAENDAVDIIEDDSTLQIGITRTNSTGIYNPFTEQGYDSATSPAGTTWNADGWDDLTDLITRTYTSFNTAASGYNNVLGKKFVMYAASIQKYYAIQFYEWATDGNNNFAYVRYEIDQTKLNEGITFADGTKLKSAEGVGRVKSTAVGNRRIEEVTGYNQVSVTERVTNDYTGISTRTTATNYEIFVERTEILDAIFQPIWENSGATFEISFDNVTFQSAYLSSVQETEYWFYYNNNNSYVPQTQGDSVYIRVITGADPVVWWDKADLPGGSQYFRGAVIDYHAWTGESTIIGSIHIVDDSGEEHISHQEVQSGTTDGENDDLWLVQNEGTISYRRIDGESKTLKIHWTAKVFYGSEYYD